MCENKHQYVGVKGKVKEIKVMDYRCQEAFI